MTWQPFTPTAQTVRIIAATDQTMRLAVFLDQHRNAAAGFPDGRGWWGYVQRAANGADLPGLVGSLQPIGPNDAMIRGKLYKGWIAPWYPEDKYINEHLGALDGNHFEIDYAKMDQDYQTAQDSYYQGAIQAALAHELPIPILGGAVDYRVRAIVGKGPKSPRIAQAAKTGHQWLLGFSDEPDEMLARLISVTSGAFEMPTPEQMKSNVSEVDDLRLQLAALSKQMQELFAKAGDDVSVPSDVKPKKKRTLSPEHLAKLKAGREKSLGAGV